MFDVAEPAWQVQIPYGHLLLCFKLCATLWDNICTGGKRKGRDTEILGRNSDMSFVLLKSAFLISCAQAPQKAQWKAIIPTLIQASANNSMGILKCSTQKHCTKSDLLPAKPIILKEIEISLVQALILHSFWFLRCHSKCLQASLSGAVLQHWHPGNGVNFKSFYAYIN